MKVTKLKIIKITTIKGTRSCYYYIDVLFFSSHSSPHSRTLSIAKSQKMKRIKEKKNISFIQYIYSCIRISFITCDQKKKRMVEHYK